MPDRSRLATRLDSQAAGFFFGRTDELAVLRGVLTADGPVVIHVSGLAGLGKSTLMAAFADEARAAGATVLRLDCRLVEPTERGFLAELGQLTGENVETLGDAVATLARGDGPIILALDHYETFQLLDTWLRQDFLPAAPDRVRLVLASRQPPVPRWTTSPQWQGLFRTLALQPLDHQASLKLLTATGLDAAEAEAMAAVARGNPLALKLAAAAALADPSLSFRDAAIHEVMQQLTTLYLADVKDATIRDAIRFTSVARRVTRSLLRALELTDDTIFDALRALPFVDSLRDGLRVHDAVREAAAHTLRAEDPGRYNACRRQAWRQLREEFQTAPRADVWRYTADMLYLIENAVWREAFFPSGRPELAIEPACAADLDAIRAIAVGHEGPAAVAALESWWSAQPRHVRVAHDGDGEVAAFYCMCESTELTDAVRAADPVVDAWCDHLLDEPVPAGNKVLFIRRWLTRDEGEAPSPGQAACWLDIKRTYMELRPLLRRAYLTVIDLPTYAPVARQLGFRLLPEWSTDLDGATYHATVLDFGPASVDGWITRLVGDELGIGDRSPLDRERRALVLDGHEVALTRLEYGLAEYLEDRPGATVSRDELLDTVWGHADGSGSSNVVDAVVKSLRRKLGPDAGLIETVRGHGYRWREA